MTELRVLPDGARVAAAASALLRDELSAAVAARGAAHLALAGGSTPKATYERLAADEAMLWEGLELWLGDERVVPDGDPDSNLRMARDALAAAPLADEQWHRVRTELGAEEAARAYGALLAERATPAGAAIPVLDVALQGIGPDGHTASLFPHHPLLEVTDAVCAPILDSPKPPPERVTLTLPVLRAARRIVILVTGEEKAAPLAQIAAGPDPAVPASLLGGEKTVVIADEAAAAQVR